MQILVLLDAILFLFPTWEGFVMSPPYNANEGACEKDMPIVTGATAYTCQSSGQTFILVINEGLWFGPKLSHSLFNQNQI